MTSKNAAPTSPLHGLRPPKARQAAELSGSAPSQRNRELRHALLRHAAKRGATLLEVIVVIAIMAMIAGGVGFAVFKKFGDAKVGTAETGAKNIRKVVMGYLALKGTKDCPSMATLVTENEVDGDTKDPWGNPYTIECTEDDVIVSSSGPDGQDNSGDEIVARKATAEEE
jgi:general secretion pathway protein G